MTEANPRPMHRDETGRRRVLLRKLQRGVAVQNQLADHADQAADEKAVQQILSQRRFFSQPRHIAVIFLRGHVHTAPLPCFFI